MFSDFETLDVLGPVEICKIKTKNTFLKNITPFPDTNLNNKKSTMTNSRPIIILAIPGSLTSTSANLNILKTIADIAPENTVIEIFQGLGKLPHFNPETSGAIPEVDHFKQQVSAADGVIIATPEYAFGVPGVLKNALDWLVFTGELNDKPVVAISASTLYTGGDKALASLLQTLSALGTSMNAGSSLSIGNIKSKMTDTGLISDSKTKQDLYQILENLIKMIGPAFLEAQAS